MNLKKIVEDKKFTQFTTLLILVNFIVLVFSTRGHETFFIENIILLYFTFEVWAKVMVYKWRKFWENPWNKFDFTIVAVWIIPLLGFSLPSWASWLRAIRILRLIGTIPSFRDIVGAIAKSLKQMAAVGGITLILMMICTLMVTLSFQETMPQYFWSMFTSFGTLLQMAAFSQLDLVGIAWQNSIFGTLLVFPLFFLGVPLMTLNLIIWVLGNALSEEKAEPQAQIEMRKNIVYLCKKIDTLEELLQKKNQK